jgi:predicted RNase H-like HicB family nuclease
MVAGIVYNIIMNQREFTAIYQKKGKWIIAWVEEIPGVNTQGRTQKEAKENLKEALRLILETNHALSVGKAVETKRESLRVAMPV